MTIKNLELKKLKKMKRIFKTSLLTLMLGSIIALSSCVDYYFDVVRGDGILVSEERVVNDFSSVELSGEFDIYILKDTVNKVEVEAESSIMPYIITGVRNGKLIVKSRDNAVIKNTLPMKVYVSMIDIEDIILSGSGNIETVDNFQSKHLYVLLSGSGNIYGEIDADDVEVDISGSGNIELVTNTTNVDATISGSGDIELIGSSIESDFRISGSGNILAFNLPQDVCNTTISGSGSVYVDASQLLDVLITGSGNVYYKGNPVINQKILGSGSVIHK